MALAVTLLLGATANSSFALSTYSTIEWFYNDTQCRPKFQQMTAYNFVTRGSTSGHVRIDLLFSTNTYQHYAGSTDFTCTTTAAFKKTCISKIPLQANEQQTITIMATPDADGGYGFIRAQAFEKTSSGGWTFTHTTTKNFNVCPDNMGFSVYEGGVQVPEALQ